MIGWRGRIGVLVPPGNPTVEPETQALLPPGCSVHYTRMSASGATGSLSGQEERNRQMISGLHEAVGLLALVRPGVVALAHTSVSYSLGRAGEAALTAEIEGRHGVRFTTAFAGVVAWLRDRGVRRLSLGTPYSMQTTERGKALLEEEGFEVVRHGVLPGVANIYDETEARAYALGRMVDDPAAEAVFLSGVGMPTLGALPALRADLGKPVISASAAMMWWAGRVLGVG